MRLVMPQPPGVAVQFPGEVGLDVVMFALSICRPWRQWCQDDGKQYGFMRAKNDDSISERADLIRILLLSTGSDIGKSSRPVTRKHTVMKK